MSEEELEKLGLTKGELSTIIAKGLVNTFKDLANAKKGEIINIEEINELLKEKNKEIERLNNIINEAIKGIEDFYYGDKEYTKYAYTLAYQIYHILKGSDEE